MSLHIHPRGSWLKPAWWTVSSLIIRSACLVFGLCLLIDASTRFCRRADVGFVGRLGADRRDDCHRGDDRERGDALHGEHGAVPFSGEWVSAGMTTSPSRRLDTCTRRGELGRQRSAALTDDHGTVNPVSPVPAWPLPPGCTDEPAAPAVAQRADAQGRAALPSADARCSLASRCQLGARTPTKGDELETARRRVEAPICRYAGYAGRKLCTGDLGLLAMQKVQGSSPFSRVEESPAATPRADSA